MGERGLALCFAAQKLRGDRDVALAAVRRDPDALRYVADRLRADREIVRSAVAGGGLDTFFSAIGGEDGDDDYTAVDNETVELLQDSTDLAHFGGYGLDSSEDAMCVATSDGYECNCVDSDDIPLVEAAQVETETLETGAIA